WRRRRGFSPFPTRRDRLLTREEMDLEPPVERLQPWSLLALAQGTYYVAAGALPLVHPRWFAKAGAPKLLTKALGACCVNVGAHLIRAALRGGRPRRDERGLALRMADRQGVDCAREDPDRAVSAVAGPAHRLLPAHHGLRVLEVGPGTAGGRLPPLLP